MIPILILATLLSTEPKQLRKISIPPSDIVTYSKIIRRLHPWLKKEKSEGYAKIILTESKRFKIDPVLVIATIHQESKFQAHQVSRTNDYGLMQLHISKTSNPEFIGRESDILDVELNIRKGIKLMAFFRKWHNKNCGQQPDHSWWVHYIWGFKNRSSKHMEAKNDRFVKKIKGHLDKIKKVGGPRMMINLEAMKDRNKKLRDLYKLSAQSWLEKSENKNKNYGDSWVVTGTILRLMFPQGVELKTEKDFVVIGLLTRMLDKFVRAGNLTLGKMRDEVGEKVSDTLFDLGIYSFLAGVASCMGNTYVLQTQINPKPKTKSKVKKS